MFQSNHNQIIVIMIKVPPDPHLTPPQPSPSPLAQGLHSTRLSNCQHSHGITIRQYNLKIQRLSLGEEAVRPPPDSARQSLDSARQSRQSLDSPNSPDSYRQPESSKRTERTGHSRRGRMGRIGRMGRDGRDRHDGRDGRDGRGHCAGDRLYGYRSPSHCLRIMLCIKDPHQTRTHSDVCLFDTSKFQMSKNLNAFWSDVDPKKEFCNVGHGCMWA